MEKEQDKKELKKEPTKKISFIYKYLLICCFYILISLSFGIYMGTITTTIHVLIFIVLLGLPMTLVLILIKKYKIK